MKVEKRKSSIERRILIAMIVDSVALGRISSRWPTGKKEEGLFKSQWSNLIAKWCIDHFNKYRRAPGRLIEAKFEKWSEKAPDEHTVKLVERFLLSLSGQYKAMAKEINPDYILDIAAEHFDQVRLSKLADAIQDDIDTGSVADAAKKVEGYNRIELGLGSSVNILQDKAAIQAAFEERQESIIKYPGALGDFFGSAFERDGFVAFMGPEKRGKTWWLMDVAWRAMIQRRRVAFFEVGDMSQNQILRRFMVRASGRPLKPKLVRMPTSITNDDGEIAVEFEDKNFAKRLSWQRAWKACQKVITSKVKSTESYLRLSVHANSTISVRGVEEILQTWNREGWSPDIIVIDYADILAPINGFDETRHQINKTWMALRSLSQKLHCCVVTATQSDAASYRADVLGREHFSESKTKLAHCTGMVGINASPEEKEEQRQRLNWVVLREDEFYETKCVHVAGCLSLANPAVKSTA